MAATLRPGADMHFDNILHSLGTVAQHCPKVLVDAIMVWRKAKSEGDVGVERAARAFPQLRANLDQILRERKSVCCFCCIAVGVEMLLVIDIH